MGRGEARAYWASSRSHRYSLLFALPLLLAYELLELISPVRVSGGIVRNGADVILTGLFTSLLGPRGPLVFMGLVIGGAILLIWRDRRVGPLRAGTFAAMMMESVTLALVFGLVVGTVTIHLLGPLRALAAGGIASATPVARLTMALGAGLYEELLFRVVLVALLANGLRMLGAGRLFAGALATVVGAVLFSAFHYMGSLGEPYRLETFVFRSIAGLAFSALYLTRGFGITAWTHALYDVAVLF